MTVKLKIIKLVILKSEFKTVCSFVFLFVLSVGCSFVCSFVRSPSLAWLELRSTGSEIRKFESASAQCLVSFAAAFWDVSLGERCVTSQKAAAKETTHCLTYVQSVL